MAGGYGDKPLYWVKLDCILTVEEKITVRVYAKIASTEPVD